MIPTTDEMEIISNEYIFDSVDLQRLFEQMITIYGEIIKKMSPPDQNSTIVDILSYIDWRSDEGIRLKSLFKDLIIEMKEYDDFCYDFTKDMKKEHEEFKKLYLQKPNGAMNTEVIEIYKYFIESRMGKDKIEKISNKNIIDIKNGIDDTIKEIYKYKKQLVKTFTMKANLLIAIYKKSPINTKEIKQNFIESDIPKKPDSIEKHKFYIPLKGIIDTINTIFIELEETENAKIKELDEIKDKIKDEKKQLLNAQNLIKNVPEFAVEIIPSIENKEDAKWSYMGPFKRIEEQIKKGKILIEIFGKIHIYLSTSIFKNKQYSIQWSKEFLSELSRPEFFSILDSIFNQNKLQQDKTSKGGNKINNPLIRKQISELVLKLESLELEPYRSMDIKLEDRFIVALKNPTKENNDNIFNSDYNKLDSNRKKNLDEVINDITIIVQKLKGDIKSVIQKESSNMITILKELMEKRLKMNYMKNIEITKILNIKEEDIIVYKDIENDIQLLEDHIKHYDDIETHLERHINELKTQDKEIMKVERKDDYSFKIFDIIREYKKLNDDYIITKRNLECFEEASNFINERNKIENFYIFSKSFVIFLEGWEEAIPLFDLKEEKFGLTEIDLKYITNKISIDNLVKELNNIIKDFNTWKEDSLTLLKQCNINITVGIIASSSIIKDIKQQDSVIKKINERQIPLASSITQILRSLSSVYKYIENNWSITVRELSDLKKKNPLYFKNFNLKNIVANPDSILSRGSKTMKPGEEKESQLLTLKTNLLYNMNVTDWSKLFDTQIPENIKDYPNTFVVLVKAYSNLKIAAAGMKLVINYDDEIRPLQKEIQEKLNKIDTNIKILVNNDATISELVAFAKNVLKLTETTSIFTEKIIESLDKKYITLKSQYDYTLKPREDTRLKILKEQIINLDFSAIKNYRKDVDEIVLLKTQLVEIENNFDNIIKYIVKTIIPSFENYKEKLLGDIEKINEKLK